MLSKSVRITGLHVGLYRDYDPKPLLYRRRLVEPAWIELWFKATEGGWDEHLWDQISDQNKDWFSHCYHASDQPNNKLLEIAICKKFKSVQQRLILLEGMIMAGNINEELINELNTILDSLVESYQLHTKQAARMKNRVRRTYAEIQKSVV